MMWMLIAAAAFVGTPAKAAAETCDKQVAGMLLQASERAPAQGMMRTETKGQDPMTSEFLYQTPDHYLYKPVDPADTPWTLTHDGAMYQSSDKGQTWNRIHTFDPEQSKAQAAVSLESQIATIRDAVCGTEELDGLQYNVMEATMTSKGSYTFDIRSKYWVDDGGFVVQATSLMTGEGFESFVTQTWIRPEIMDLPIPE